MTRILKTAALWSLLLVLLCMVGCITLFILNLIRLAEVENVVPLGVKVGFVAWLLLTAGRISGRTRI